MATRLISACLLLTLCTFAAAQPEARSPPTIYPELGDELVLSGELGCADVVSDSSCVGFRPFLRVGIGGYHAAIHNGKSYGDWYDSVTPEEPEFFGHDLVPHGSFELMGQHIWQDGRLVNARPAPRIGVATAGIDLEGGYLPLADLGIGVKNRDSDQWRAANYAAYGLGTAGYRSWGRIDMYATSVSVVSLYDDNTSYHIWWDTRVEQIIVGPKFRVGRVASYGRWLFDANASLLVGYGHADFREEIGEGIVGQSRGVIRDSINGGSSTAAIEDSRDYFAAAAGLELTSSYFVNRHLSVGLTAGIDFIGPVYQAKFTSWLSPTRDLIGERDNLATSYNLGANLTYTW